MQKYKKSLSIWIINIAENEVMKLLILILLVVVDRGLKIKPILKFYYYLKKFIRIGMYFLFF